MIAELERLIESLSAGGDLAVKLRGEPAKFLYVYHMLGLLDDADAYRLGMASFIVEDLERILSGVRYP